MPRRAKRGENPVAKRSRHGYPDRRQSSLQAGHMAIDAEDPPVAAAHGLEQAVGQEDAAIEPGQVEPVGGLQLTVDRDHRSSHRTCSTEGGMNGSSSSPPPLPQGAIARAVSLAPSARVGSEARAASPRMNRSSMA